MPSIVILGAQWGDEGKGKVVDYLTEKAELVVRFQGGNNAGHTVIVDGKKTALRIIPSGILRKNTRCLLASGVVLDPEVFNSEVQDLQNNGIEINKQRLGIAPEISLILPYHRTIDLEQEKLRQLYGRQIGTTGKGIGPTYEDMVSRNGIRVYDLLDQDRLRQLITSNVKIKNALLQHVLDSNIQFNADEIYENLCDQAKLIVPLITNVSLELDKAYKKKSLICFEGAQGSLLDIHHGTYPYVTSSCLVSGYACASSGFSPKQIDHIIGITKAYATRVGEGPFPTEDVGSDGDHMRSVGKEFGTVTGRPRRCGWLDLVALRKAIRISGIEQLLITKLDVLTGIKDIKIATSYSLNGKPIEDLPVNAVDCEKVEVTYDVFKGWDEDLTQIRSYDELPETIKTFFSRIEEYLGISICGFSVGPDRMQTIIMDNSLKSTCSM